MYLKMLRWVKQIADDSDYTYGSRRMKKALNALSFPVSRNKARKLMKEAGVKVRQRKKYKVTTDSNHQLPLFENLVDRQFAVAKPDQVYVADITYIYSRKVVGWSMNSRMKAQLVCDALEMAI